MFVASGSEDAHIRPTEKIKDRQHPARAVVRFHQLRYNFRQRPTE